MKIATTILDFFWKKSPWYIKVIMVAYIGPVAGIVLILWFLLMLPTAQTKIEAAVTSSEERISNKFNSTLEKQNLELKSMNENLKRIDQHQTIMFEAMVNKK